MESIIECILGGAIWISFWYFVGKHTKSHLTPWEEEQLEIARLRSQWGNGY